MAGLQLRRITVGTREAVAQLKELTTALSAQGNVVSPRSQQMTLDVFGAALTPQQVVERICHEVQTQGREAVFRYTEKFDNTRLTPTTLRVSANELKKAHTAADESFLETIRRIRYNVLSFQSGILHRDAILTMVGSHELRLRYRPIRRVGVLVPGGAAAYPSTLLMTIVPAQAAGVKELAVVMPPTANGANNPNLLAVCHELGVRQVYRIGGAQAVAALAYGIDGLPAVDMIVGPGNLYVALAKKLVYGQVNIDCIAGPSEIVVVGDDTADPAQVAADLIAQAEHSPGASILVTWHPPLADRVAVELERQLASLSRSELASDSLQRFGAFVLPRTEQQAIETVNLLAPEHLHLLTKDAKAFAEKIDNAGAIFVGPWSPVAVGDYAAGPSHVLPTGGTARWASGLSAVDFLRRSSVIEFTQAGLERIAPDVVQMANIEGLTGHAASVEIRVAPAPAEQKRP